MRVLLIEDDSATAKMLEATLKSEGFVVDITDLGEDGLEIGKLYEYDMILLDLVLPDMNGYDVLKRLRSANVKTPILILSGLSEIEDKVKGLGFGADDYLTKPFAFDELLARIRALLRRPQMGSNVGKTLSCLDLKMDLVERKITRADQPIDLTQKELSLLRYLLQNRNRPVSRTELLEHVWDVHFDQGSNVVDVYMNMLRKKVDHPFEKKLLHTVVGYGYVLKEGE